MRETNVIEVLSTAQTAGLDAATSALDRESAAALRLAAASNQTGAASNQMAAATNGASAAVSAGAAASNQAAAANNALAAAENTVAAASNQAAAGLNTAGAAASSAAASANSASGAFGGLGASMSSLGGVSRGVSGIGQAMQLASQGTGGLTTALTGLGGSGLLAATGVGAVVVGAMAIGGQALSAAGQMETFETQLGVLLGSTDKAKERIAELTQFAATTPFEIPEVVKASKVLQTFGGDALATGDALRAVGDVAAGTGLPFDQMALIMGRIQVMMQQGLVPSDQLIQLQAMGALTVDGKKKIEAFAEAVRNGQANAGDAFKVLVAQTGQFAGMMEKQSATFEGKLSNLQDAIGGVFRAIGQVILPVAKAVLDVVIPIVSAIGTFISKLASGGPAIGGFGTLLEKVGAIFAKVATLLKPFVDTILKNLGFAFQVISEVVLPGVIAGLGMFIDIVGALLTFVSPAVEALGSVFSAVFGAIRDVIKAVIGAILEAANAIVGVAASIPGPWQDTAVQMKTTLEGMKADVAAWGTETKEVVDDAATAPAEALTAAVPATEAASGALGTAMQSGPKAAKGAMEQSATEAAAGIAKGLRDGRTVVTTATDFLTETFKTAISPMKEVAKLEAMLAGTKLADQLDSANPKIRKAAKRAWQGLVDEMEDPKTKPSRKAEIEATLTATMIERGLRSKNPEIRAAAESAKLVIEERLFALKNGVPQLALDTGQGYASALLSTQAKSAAAAAAHAKQVKRLEMADEAGAWGRQTGYAWADAIDSPANIAKARAAARNLANAAAAVLRASSPPGPESPLHEIDVWGSNTAEAWADGMADGLRAAAYSARNGVGAVIGAFKPAVPALAVGGVVPGSLGLGGGGGFGTMIGEINVYLPQGWSGTTQETADLSETLAQEIRLRAV